MDTSIYRSLLGLTTALGLVHALPAAAQTTPGDRSGTPAAAGDGQSAASTTNAPATAAPRGRATPSSSAGDGTGDIVVTARRIEERLQDVPISITVFNQQQVTARNIVNTSDLAAYTPSLSANTNFGQENASFAIRGFVQDAGTAPSVGVYFADVVALRGPTQGTQAGDTAGPGSFFDLQNIQVLKGPQGTLFGRNTTGGAILFVPQKPTGRLEGFVEGSYGNFDMKRVQGAINIPLTDNARFRIAGDYLNRDGYLNNLSGVGPAHYNDVNYFAIRASLVVDLTPDLENYTIASYSKSDTNGSVQKLIAANQAGYNPVNPAAGFPNFIGVFSASQLAKEGTQGYGFYDLEAAVANPRSRVTTWQVINTTTWRASDTLTLKNITSYGQFTDFQRSPLFGANWQSTTLPPAYQQIFFRGIPAIFTGIFPAPGLESANQYTLTEEFQVQGSGLGSKLTYQAGAYFESSRPLNSVGNQSSQLTACANLATLDCTDPVGSSFTAAYSQALGFTLPIQVGAVNYTVGRTAFRNIGLYAQATYALTDALKLTGGFRYTFDRQTNTATRVTNNYAVTFPYPPGVYHYAVTGVSGAGLPIYTAIPGPTCTDGSPYPNCTRSLAEKSSRPTWLINLDYKPDDRVLLYAKYARGYRAGGIFSNAPSDLRSFRPEKVDNYEVGVKGSTGGPLAATLNIAGFYNNFSDQQLQFGFDARVNPATGASASVSPTTAILNAGKSRIYGVEVEAGITPVRGLRFDASYTYLNATIRKITDITGNGGRNCLEAGVVQGCGTTDPNYQLSTQPSAGVPLILSPKNKYTVTGSYTLPLDSSVGRVSVGATFTHSDSQRTSYAYLASPALFNAFGRDYGVVGQRNLLNLNASWASIAGLPIDLSAFATNVTQKRYYAYVPGLGSSGAEFAVLGEPRMYGVRLKYRFGAR